MQSFVSERSIDQDLACVDRFSCKLDDMIQSIQCFGCGNYIPLSVSVSVLVLCCFAGLLFS